MEAEEWKKIQEVLTPLFQEAGVQKAFIFGSFATGMETRKSDLDIAIIMETKERFFDRYSRFERINSLIDDRAIDLLIYTPQEFAAIAHRPFIKKIVQEGKVLYEHRKTL